MPEAFFVVSGEEGIVLLKVTECGMGDSAVVVSGPDHGRIGKRFDARKTLKHDRRVPSREICSADRINKKSVSGKEVVTDKKALAARCVPGCGHDPNVNAANFDLCSFICSYYISAFGNIGEEFVL